MPSNGLVDPYAPKITPKVQKQIWQCLNCPYPTCDGELKNCGGKVRKPRKPRAKRTAAK